jgi:hypothetical protein
MLFIRNYPASDEKRSIGPVLQLFSSAADAPVSADTERGLAALHGVCGQADDKADAVLLDSYVYSVNCSK